MIKALIALAANIASYFFSEDYRKKKALKERDAINAEVAAGDEDAVNARLGRCLGLPWILIGLVLLGGCIKKRVPVYVREQDRSYSLQPGGVYTNESDSVVWIVPRKIFADLVILAAEGKGNNK